jgi:hypothetical protein
MWILFHVPRPTPVGRTAHDLYEKRVKWISAVMARNAGPGADVGRRTRPPGRPRCAARSSCGGSAACVCVESPAPAGLVAGRTGSDYSRRRDVRRHRADRERR